VMSISLAIRKKKGTIGVPVLLSLVFFVLYTIYALSRHAQALTAGYDLGIFSQAVARYSDFAAPIVPLKGIDFNLLGDHFHPILAFLAPAWLVAPSPVTLLVIQAGLLASSIVPVWRVAARRMSIGLATVIASVYALSWPLQGMVDFDFHEVAFAVPLIALALDQFDEGRMKWAVVAAAPLILVREDMFVILIGFAVLAVLRRKWIVSGIFAGLACLGYVIAMLWVIPYFSPTGEYLYWSLGQFGPDFSTALQGMIADPIRALTLIFTPEEKIITLLLLFIPYAFLAVFSPYSILALPIILQRFLSDREVYWGTEFHYSGILAPIIAIASIDGVSRLCRHTTLNKVWLYRGFAIWSAGFLLFGLIFSSTLYPFQRLFTGEAFDISERVKNIERIVSIVPERICVEADDRIVPQLLMGRTVTLFGGSDGLATAIVLDLSQEELGRGEDITPAQALDLALARGFRVAGQEGEIVLLIREGIPDPACSELSL